MENRGLAEARTGVVSMDRIATGYLVQPAGHILFADHVMPAQAGIHPPRRHARALGIHLLPTFEGVGAKAG